MFRRFLPTVLFITIAGTLLLACFLYIRFGGTQIGQSVAKSNTDSSFTDELVTTVDLPIGIAFTPDQRLLITTQNGYVYVDDNSGNVPKLALDWSERICTERERGLVGIAVDPEFATNQFIYLYYTFKKYGGCEIESKQSPVNRVVRVTLQDNNIIDPATELVLIDNIFSYGSTHNGGDLKFGNDGYLYVSVGDSGRDYAGRIPGSRGNPAARDQHVLVGKILRITTNGDIPPTNPYLGRDTARCSKVGQTDSGKKCQEIFAWGLRNPFRIAFDPTTPETRFFINDTGQDVWEEINLGQAGADYGWNFREGKCVRDSAVICGDQPAGMTAPLYAYGHRGCGAITAGVFVPSGVWPSRYDGSYLFSDFMCPFIFHMKGTGSGSYNVQPLLRGPGLTISMIFGPYGRGQALYYTTFANGGEVRRVNYTQPDKPLPSVLLLDSTPTNSIAAAAREAGGVAEQTRYSLLTTIARK